MNSIANTAPSGNTDEYISKFDGDEDDWYIMQVAHENGDDPRKVLRQVRHRQKLLGQQAAPETQPADMQGPGSSTTMQWPPGQAGVIARFIFSRSYSPVREIAIAATLGLLAGVCARAYRTYAGQGKDLGLYLLLVTKSGVGKEAIHEGIPLMLNLATVPQAERFLRQQDFASGEALHKELLNNPGFLALQGEFGRKLKRMSNPTDTPMQNVRSLLTNAYGKQFLEGKSYSDNSKTLPGVNWPALSFLGETTPGTFLECLTPDMMEDGFMSRFLTINYTGDRPPPNRNPTAVLDKHSMELWQALLKRTVCFQPAINMPTPAVVEPDQNAKLRLEAAEEDYIRKVNAITDEAERQTWSRAHLKALKVASLLAVADNWSVPMIREEHADWALGLVQGDIAMFQSRKRTGDVGIDDDARVRKLGAILTDYLHNPVPKSYEVPDAMHTMGVVPHDYLRRRVREVASFCNHKQGANRALEDAIRVLVNSGHLIDVEKSRLTENYSHFGKAYRIVKLPQ